MSNVIDVMQQAMIDVRWLGMRLRRVMQQAMVYARSDVVRSDVAKSDFNARWLSAGPKQE